MIPYMELYGPRIRLRPFQTGDGASLLEIHEFNRESFERVSPVRSPEFFTESAQDLQIQADLARWRTDLGYAFAVVLGDRIIGRMALSNVVRGAWQNATLGYWIDARFQDQGFATEAVRGIVTAAFEVLSLHRVQAAIMPKNAPSLKVIEKLGFNDEGLATHYLNINGRWEDHRIFSLTREQYLGFPGWTVHMEGDPS